MTRYDYIREAPIEKVAEILCNIVDNTETHEKNFCGNNCDGCLARKDCNYKANGFVEWLKKEVTYCENCDAVKVYD